MALVALGWPLVLCFHCHPFPFSLAPISLPVALISCPAALGRLQRVPGLGRAQKGSARLGCCAEAQLSLAQALSWALELIYMELDGSELAIPAQTSPWPCTSSVLGGKQRRILQGTEMWKIIKGLHAFILSPAAAGALHFPPAAEILLFPPAAGILLFIRSCSRSFGVLSWSRNFAVCSLLQQEFSCFLYPAAGV